MEVAAQVQAPMSADGQQNPLKICTIPRIRDNRDTSTSLSSVPTASLPQRHHVVTNSDVLSLANQGYVQDYAMQPHEASPPLSSSDVLMSSFNVLEDGDPVHSYQLHGGARMAGHQHSDGTSTDGTLHSWSDTELDHNSQSILRTLKEPQERQPREVSWKPLTSQHLYTTRDGQRHIDSVITTRARADQWTHSEEHNNVQNYKVHSSESSSFQNLNYTTQYKSIKLLQQPEPMAAPDTTTEGTLTRALKETFCIAHFSCTHCSEKFRVPEKLAEHVKKVHSGSIVYTCFTCSKKFYNSFDLREHVVSHANDPIKCSLCDLTLPSSKELRNHHKKMHQMTGITCTLCEKIFTTASARTKHLLVDHQNDSRLILCDICGDAFVDKTAHEEHCKRHQQVTEKPSAARSPEVVNVPKAVVVWKCDKCGVIFRNDIELGIHKAERHKEESPKPAIAQPQEHVLQEKIPIKQQSDSRYELLRLLLARRMASSKTPPMLANIDAQNIPEHKSMAPSDISGRMKSPILTNDRGLEHHNQGSLPVLLSNTSGKGPGILSAEAMQHVADELSILEQTMDTKKRQATKLPPMTADMMMQGESTIGLNLAFKKDSTQEMKFKEIQKQKTLVNMLQGTVASIIEKEVKNPKVVDKIKYSIPPQVLVENPNNLNINQSGGLFNLTEYGSQNPYGKQNDKNMENNNVIYENRNLSANFNGGEHQIGSLSHTTEKGHVYMTTNTDSFHQTPLCSTLPIIQSDRDSYELLQRREAENKYNKTTSPWDDHIEPLLKLFQDVSSPPMNKASDENQFAKQNTDDQRWHHMPPRDDILDLSQSHPILPHDTLQTRNSEEVPMPESGELRHFEDMTPMNLGNTNTQGGIQQTSTVPVPSSAQLPHFSDVSWTNLINEKDAGDKTPISRSMMNDEYASYTTLSQPHSNLNQMSGGHLQYAEVKQSEGYFRQHSNAHENIVTSPILLEQKDHHSHQQTYDYQGVQQAGQSYALRPELVQSNLQQSSQIQSRPQASFLAERQMRLQENENQLSPAQQQMTFTPSPAEQSPQDNEITYTDVGLGGQKPYVSTVGQNQYHVSGNYGPGAPGNHTSTDQQQLRRTQVTPSSPAVQLKQSRNNVIQQNKPVRCINEKVTKAITQYLSTRNTFLSKKKIPEVPLVVRHKLLATILTNANTQDNDQSQNPTSEQMPHRSQSVSTSDTVRNRLISEQIPEYQFERQTLHSNTTPSQNVNGSYTGCISSTNNSLFENTPNQENLHNRPVISETMSSTNTLLKQTLSQPDVGTRSANNPLIRRSPSEPITSATRDTYRNRSLSQSNTSTIDSQLLNQMMLSELLSPVPLPQHPSPENRSKTVSPWSSQEPKPNLPHEQNTQANYFPRSEHIQPDSIPRSYGSQVQCTAKLSRSNFDEKHMIVSQDSHDHRLPGKNGGTVTPCKKRRLIGPASRKRRAVIIIQKAEDAFFIKDERVNVSAPKRGQTCEELFCRIATRPTPRMRGRPPKNGKLPVRKGSYKKGKYPCPVCGKCYAWKNYLRIHIARHDDAKVANT